jgi:ribosomal protein S18 acetylase RimI-like enzyme
MKIRKMTIDDYEEVYDLCVATPGIGLNEIDDSKAGIEKYLKRNPNTCFVAETDGKIVGVILAGHDGRRGFIYHTAVATDYRNKGIGSALVDSALKALREEGISKVALVVFGRNEVGNSFWEQKGFHVREDLVYRNKALTEIRKSDP